MGQGCCGSGGKKKVDTGVDYNTVMEIAQTTGMEMMELREYYADFLKVRFIFFFHALSVSAIEKVIKKYWD